jgi:uncharacterized membrane protein/thiol-disulfide isomerase/thioredoxin
MSRSIRIVAVYLLIALLLPSVAFAQAPVVRAVLFYSPSCSHCQHVINDVLPPLFETYGDQLQIVGIDVTVAEGSALYASAVDALGVPEDQRGVPMLFVGDVVLVGDADIPDVFPGLIDQGLAKGGIDWPAIPGLSEVLGEPVSATPDTEPTPAQPMTVAERLQQDPVGNTLASVVLIGMVLSLVSVIARWVLTVPVREAPIASWLVPLLGLIGMGVAAYLTIIELSGEPAVCGPVGDCNAVQQSSYAFLFGVMPVGALGVIGYSAIILAWAATRYLPGRAYDLMQIALSVLALVGTLFSIYLTFLEPFVIGATCAWCLTSAILQTLLLWLTADPARAAFARLQGSATAQHPSRKPV